jgi:hypothetical protein
MTQNLKRNIALTFRVDEAERDFIRRKMKAVGISNLRAYLLKMAADGRIFKVDMTDVQQCGRLLRNVSNNVNQITKRVNGSGHIYAADLADIKNGLGEVWSQQERIITALTQIVEAA